MHHVTPELLTCMYAQSQGTTPEQLEEIRRNLGLDQPIYIQYVPEPLPKAEGRGLSPTTKIGPDGPNRPGIRQLFGERACQGAHPVPSLSDDALNWPTFAPPSGRFLLRR